MTHKQRQNLLQFLQNYDPGIPDDIWGDRSRRAMEAFQRDHGLPVTGTGNEATDAALLHAVATWEPAEDVNVPGTGTFWDEIEFFERKEFRCPCGACGGFPLEPKEAIVRAVDEMRRAFGSPVIIVPPDGHSGGSGVRCQTYNDSLKGSAKNSRHVQGKAVDFSAPGVPASVIEEYLADIQENGTIRYWYKISTGAYHMDVA